MNYRDFPELQGICAPHSAEWYRRVRAIWIERHPDLDQTSRDNLDMFIRLAEEKGK